VISGQICLIHRSILRDGKAREPDTNKFEGCSASAEQPSNARVDRRPVERLLHSPLRYLRTSRSTGRKCRHNWITLHYASSIMPAFSPVNSGISIA